MKNSVLFMSMSALCLPIVISVPAHAQGGLQVLEQIWDPVRNDLRSVPAFRDSNYLNAIANDAWDKARPDIETQLIALLGKGKLLAGQTAYNIELNLAKDGTVIAASDGGRRLAFTLSLKNNGATFKTTQPTALGSYADPKFGVTFDLEAEVVLSIPADLSNITVVSEQCVVRTVNGKLTSQNVVADLIQFASSVSDFFGGPDFWRQVEEQLNRERKIGAYVAQALPPLNQALANLRTKGYQLLQNARSLMASEQPRPTLVASAGKATLLRRDDSPFVTLRVYKTDYGVPTVGMGIVRGVIRWDKSLGKPQVRDVYLRTSEGASLRSLAQASKATVFLRPSPFVFSAQVQNGPSTGLTGGSMKSLTRPVYGEIVEVGDAYELNYEVFDLPNDFPLQLVSISLSNKVDWVAINPQPLPPKIAIFSREGWDGTVRILKPLRRRFQTEQSPGCGGLLPQNAQIKPRIQRTPAPREIGNLPTLKIPVRHDPQARSVVEKLDFRMTVSTTPILK
ncbi:hypothetical protein [Armatimonas sp.]|uniref:hypothetical protein n=1 Tax=Armatimonas sp. TaxID=1872638 RepID=UPI00286A3837|nr:hypothetical protein [Armatimonas sp.]